MNEAVTLSFDYREADIRRAFRVVFGPKARPEAAIALSLVVMGVSWILVVAGRYQWMAMIGVMVSLVVLGFELYIFVIQPKRFFRNEPSFHDEYRLTFSGDGIDLMTSDTEALIPWQTYVAALDGKEVVVLYGSPSMFTIIPKRVLSDRQLEARFRDVVGKHLRWRIRPPDM